jgi:hypothetical protein
MNYLHVLLILAATGVQWNFAEDVTPDVQLPVAQIAAGKQLWECDRNRENIVNFAEIISKAPVKYTLRWECEGLPFRHISVTFWHVHIFWLPRENWAVNPFGKHTRIGTDTYISEREYGRINWVYGYTLGVSGNGPYYCVWDRLESDHRTKKYVLTEDDIRRIERFP